MVLYYGVVNFGRNIISVSRSNTEQLMVAITRLLSCAEYGAVNVGRNMISIWFCNTVQLIVAVTQSVSVAVIRSS